MARIVPVVLAAGDSTRMGYPKALLPFGRQSFLEVILRTLEEVPLPDPVVVLGREAERIRRSIAGRADFLHNPKPEEGLLSSLQIAIHALDAAADAILVWPVDQPFVPVSLVRSLVSAFEAARAPLVMPLCDGRRGHPAVFRRDLLEELRATPVEQGPKEVVMRHADRAHLIRTELRGTIEDIDTPDDYLRATGVSLGNALAGREKA